MEEWRLQEGVEGLRVTDGGVLTMFLYIPLLLHPTSLPHLLIQFTATQIYMCAGVGVVGFFFLYILE